MSVPAKAAPRFRPIAERGEDGRIAVYVGASYQLLPPPAAWALLGQLAEALNVPGWPPVYRFLAWVSGLRQLPERDVVMAKFHVSYPSAYRWISMERERRRDAGYFQTVAFNADPACNRAQREEAACSNDK